MKHTIVIAFIAVGVQVLAQQPFDLDTTFRTDIDPVYVNSILPLDDGKVLVSGRMFFPGVSGNLLIARLNADGTRDTTFPNFQFGGGKLTPWNGKLYVSGGQIVERSLLNGMSDPTWTHMNTFPLFISGQGGDYHVFPDGRLLFTGSHGVHDPAHGFNGQYSLVWFSNTGWLDTTRVHRQTDGAIYRIAQLDNGQFYCGGAFTQYEVQPAYALARVQEDGAYDPTFQTDILWGQPWALHPLADGRLWVGADFTFPGTTDTLRLMRFMPDGSLDPTFNTSHTFYRSFASGRLSMITNITELSPNRFVVTGYFDRIDDEVHGGIAMFDSTGTLLEDYFQGSGAGTFVYQNYLSFSIGAIMPTGDGSDDYWIWGAYHGYDDGTTNDTLQRMVSRLHGLSVGVKEQPKLAPTGSLLIRPNPASISVTFTTHPTQEFDRSMIIIRDPIGREVQHLNITSTTGQCIWDVRGRAPGAYTAELIDRGTVRVIQPFIIRP